MFIFKSPAALFPDAGMIISSAHTTLFSQSFRPSVSPFSRKKHLHVFICLSPGICTEMCARHCTYCFFSRVTDGGFMSDHILLHFCLRQCRQRPGKLHIKPSMRMHGRYRKMVSLNFICLIRK